MIASAGGNVGRQPRPRRRHRRRLGIGSRADAVARRDSGSSRRFASATSSTPPKTTTMSAATRSWRVPASRCSSADNLGPGGGGGNTAISNDGAASIIGTENMFLRMSGVLEVPDRGSADRDLRSTQKVMYLNDESDPDHASAGRLTPMAMRWCCSGSPTSSSQAIAFDMTRLPGDRPDPRWQRAG